MNREWVLFHLREAQDELSKTISDIASDPGYDVGNFVVALGHLYHHVNTAWNSRDEPPNRVEPCSEDDFYAWRQFPAADFYLGK